MPQINFYINTIITKLNTIIVDKSFVPTPSDIKSVELKKLAGRLKGNSEKETLTNILEWEERNIKFWWERWPLFSIIKDLQ
jgi:hypothetical protein